MSLDFNHDYTLQNDRVMLRPLVSTDLENLLPFALNEPELWTYSLVSAAGAEGMKAYIEAALETKRKLVEYPFIVFDKRSGSYAGCTRFYDIQLPYKTLQLGYTWYGKDFHGTGLNKNCKYLLLGLAFDQLGMERVEFRADNNNAKSIAAMKSIGCKVEGVLRNHIPTAGGGRRDSIVLSIVRSEWNDGVKKALVARIEQ